jgi:hypothetical protein
MAGPKVKVLSFVSVAMVLCSAVQDNRSEITQKAPAGVN